MIDPVKATRASVQLGHLTIDGFMLPDGSYRMSLSQAAECVGLAPRNAFDFLQSKTFKALMGEGYTVSVSEIEPDQDQVRGGSRIRALPLEVVRKYWLWQVSRGNKQALALVDALTAETLDRRFDRAFGISRSEDDWDQRLSERIIQQLEGDLKQALDFEAAARYENEYLLSVLKQHGIEPWHRPEQQE